MKPHLKLVIIVLELINFVSHTTGWRIFGSRGSNYYAPYFPVDEGFYGQLIYSPYDSNFFKPTLYTPSPPGESKSEPEPGSEDGGGTEDVPEETTDDPDKQTSSESLIQETTENNTDYPFKDDSERDGKSKPMGRSFNKKPSTAEDEDEFGFDQMHADMEKLMKSVGESKGNFSFNAFATGDDDAFAFATDEDDEDDFGDMSKEMGSMQEELDKMKQEMDDMMKNMF